MMIGGLSPLKMLSTFDGDMEAKVDFVPPQNYNL